MHHELTPLTSGEVVVEIPDGLRNDQERGDSGDSTGGGMMAGVWMGGVGVGAVFPWLCSLMMGDGHW